MLKQNNRMYCLLNLNKQANNAQTKQQNVLFTQFKQTNNVQTKQQ